MDGVRQIILKVTAIVGITWGGWALFVILRGLFWFALGLYGLGKLLQWVLVQWILVTHRHRVREPQ